MHSPENNKPLSAAQPVSVGTPDVRPQEQAACECPPLSWEYIGEELAIFWDSPYGHGKEKIASFWWPVHPIEATTEVEQTFEAIAARVVIPCSTCAGMREAVAFLNRDRDGQARLKDAARSRWQECQDRLARLETLANEITGGCADTESNLLALKAERDSLRAQVQAVRSIADQARLSDRDLRGALEAIDAALREDQR